MKKIFLLTACSSMVLASCSTDNSAAVAQQQVDSIVKSKTDILEMQYKRDNDSIINAIAVARADSMMNKKPAAPVKTNDSTFSLK